MKWIDEKKKGTSIVVSKIQIYFLYQLQSICIND